MWSEIRKIRSLKKGAEFLRQEWRREIHNFQGKSGDLALSLSAGIFIGFTPTIGFQTILCYLFARIFNKSFLAAFIGGSLVTGIPWLIPFVYFLCYKVGVLMLGKETFGNLSLTYLRSLSGKQVLVLLGKPLLLGSFFLAFIGGVGSYPVTLFLLKKVRKR